jgi:RNA polymerase sigma-B factor
MEYQTHPDPDRGLARDELIIRYGGLVRSVARRYVTRGLTHDDLVQCGYLGLIQAVDRYDPARGTSLRAYAAKMIEGEMMHLFRDHGWAVRVPRQLQEQSRRLTVVERDLTQQLGRRPTVGELAEATGEPVDVVSEGLRAMRAYASDSLDVGSGEDDAPRVGLLGGDDAGYDHVDDRSSLDAAVRRLQPRERAILRLRFEEDLTQAEIAGVLGISQMHVSRLLHRALGELRDPLADAYGTG